MTNSTNKNIEFLSNPELVAILRTILDEIDVVVSAGAHRSTTYLAVSAIEGLFGEILKLRRIGPTTVTVPGGWPKKKAKHKNINELAPAMFELLQSALISPT